MKELTADSYDYEGTILEIKNIENRDIKVENNVSNWRKWTMQNNTKEISRKR